jgi:hypothetical protein
LKKIVLVIIALVIFSGCSTWTKVVHIWQGDFLKVDVSTSLNRWKLSLDDRKFADALFGIDSELENILTSLQVLNGSNFNYKAKDIEGSKSWIAGIYLFNETSLVLKQEKSFGSQLSFSAKKCQKVFKNKEVGIRYFIVSDGNRSNLVIIKREMKGEDSAIYVVVVVDMKKLVSVKCNIFHSIAILGKNDIIISNALDRDVLSNINWKKLLQKQNKGKIHTSSGILYWMVRFIGKDPIFYVVRL